MACTYLHVLEKINAATLLDVQFQSQLALWRYRPVRTYGDLGQPHRNEVGVNSATLFYFAPFPHPFLSKSTPDWRKTIVPVVIFIVDKIHRSGFRTGFEIGPR